MDFNEPLVRRAFSQVWEAPDDAKDRLRKRIAEQLRGPCPKQPPLLCEGEGHQEIEEDEE